MKGFPFRLATTSFLFPDRILPNVRAVGPHVDEIELLFFETAYPDSLPSGADIRELALLADELDITYNVHLPLDVSLTDPDPAKRADALEIMKQVFDLAAPLSATTHTLHLPCDRNAYDESNIDAWRETARRQVTRLLDAGVQPASISVENLDYPFEWAAPVIEDLDLRVCLDVGHFLKQGADVCAMMDAWAQRTVIIHLYAPAEGRRHTGLDRMTPEVRDPLLTRLRNFTGVVCLEVFSWADFGKSLAVMKACETIM